MIEYSIYIRHGSGKPFIIHTFTDINAAKCKLYEMTSLDEDRGRPYFVDNDFFNNNYQYFGKLTYYSIKIREVTEWKKYSEYKVNEEIKGKIIYFKNYQ